MSDHETHDRLQRMHASMEETYADIWARYDAAVEAGDYTTADEADDESDPYAVGIIRTVEILLAGGGPSFRLFAVLDSDGTIDSAYTVASWFGSPDVRTTVEMDSALWRLAEREAERFADGSEQ